MLPLVVPHAGGGFVTSMQAGVISVGQQRFTHLCQARFTVCTNIKRHVNIVWCFIKESIPSRMFLSKSKSTCGCGGGGGGLCSLTAVVGRDELSFHCLRPEIQHILAPLGRITQPCVF